MNNELKNLTNTETKVTIESESEEDQKEFTSALEEAMSNEINLPPDLINAVNILHAVHMNLYNHALVNRPLDNSTLIEIKEIRTECTDILNDIEKEDSDYIKNIPVLTAATGRIVDRYRLITEEEKNE